MGGRGGAHDALLLTSRPRLPNGGSTVASDSFDGSLSETRSTSSRVPLRWRTTGTTMWKASQSGRNENQGEIISLILSTRERDGIPAV